MTDVVITSAVRTAIGKFGGTVKDVPTPQLGAAVVAQALARATIPHEAVDEVIMGNVLQAGLGQNPARQAALGAGLPPEVSALTINKVCGSGMKAMMLASSEIKAGDADIVIAGGMENMNGAPFLLKNARFGYRMNNGALIDSMVHDGLWEVYNDFHMGITGEIVAEKYGVTREDADAFSARSHERAIAAQPRFADEIVPVDVPQRKGDPVPFTTDEGPRPGTTAAKLGTLKPVFKKDGQVTAGNSSQISDGAAALTLMSREKAEELGAPPLAKIIGYAVAGRKPELIMEAPIFAVRALFEKTGMSVADFDLFEHNEAFAAASVAVAQELEIPYEAFNVNGGAIALGHPIGCSGARVVVTLLHEMRRRKAQRGLATACLGGGNATAIAIELP